ncbi:MAG: hypothetical protein CR977_02640 [Gammaproteobacteria bacterium]|nr:MAG: hypothetical protein CR977_02640 [Gammaproteobacteria bacterium]
MIEDTQALEATDTTATVADLQAARSAPAAATASAWLLPYATSSYIALPLKACQEIVEKPEVLAVPGIQEYSFGLLRWREQWLPLVDLQALLSGAKKPTELQHCVVVAYHNVEQQVQYVALSLPFLPHLLTISDNALCALPTNNSIWPKIASSCFRFQNIRVPIVDGERLFAG